jgi:hypothetical protein
MCYQTKIEDFFKPFHERIKDLLIKATFVFLRYSNVPDMKGRGQPEHKKRHCIVYISSLYMRYHGPMLFTCIIVLSCLVVKGGCTCEI